MTAPNQPYPAWMQAIGQGAYTVDGTGGGAGGSTAYGQSITTSQINSLIQGPATALTNLDAVTAISDVETMVENYLKTMPLQGLQLFQGFLPGTTAADFVDVPTSIATITSKLGLTNLSSTSADAARLMHDATILFDVFHVTYPAGAPTDPAGQTSWYGAWNDVLAYISKITGISLTAPAPTIGPAITSAGTSGANGSSWSTRLTNDLTILLDVFHLTYTSTQWTNAWTDLLALFGVVNSTTAPTNPAPTIGPAITSAQSSATTANTNAGTAQTTANTGLSWGQRLTNDLTTLLDVFHVTYTVTQWNAAWADLLVLFGIVNSTSTPSNPAPTIGSAITSAQASATTANTNAGTAQTTANSGNTNTGTFLQYTRILSDVFHLIYPAGSPSDTPTTTSGGLPTWYSAWNGLLVLEGLVKSTTAPSDTAPTTGTVIQANTATANTASTNASTAIANASAANTLAQGTVDGLYQAFNGGSSTGNAVSTVKVGATAIPATNISGQAGAAVTYGATGVGANGNAFSTPSLTWTHTPAPTDSSVYVFVDYAWSNTITKSSSVTYGGAAMSLVKSVTSSVYSGTNQITLECWQIKVTPTASPASATIVASVTQLSGSSQNIYMGANSVSYFAAKVNASNSSTGSRAGSAALAMSASSSTGKMVIAAYTIRLSGTSWTSFNQTSRYALDPGTVEADIFIGDAAGASSVSFSVSPGGGSGGTWCGLTIELSN